MKNKLNSQIQKYLRILIWNVKKVILLLINYSLTMAALLYLNKSTIQVYSSPCTLRNNNLFQGKNNISQKRLNILVTNPTNKQSTTTLLMSRIAMFLMQVIIKFNKIQVKALIVVFQLKNLNFLLHKFIKKQTLNFKRNQVFYSTQRLPIISGALRNSILYNLDADKKLYRNYGR